LKAGLLDFERKKKKEVDSSIKAAGQIKVNLLHEREHGKRFPVMKRISKPLRIGNLKVKTLSV